MTGPASPRSSEKVWIGSNPSFECGGYTCPPGCHTLREDSAAAAGWGGGALGDRGAGGLGGFVVAEAESVLDLSPGYAIREFRCEYIG